MYLAWLIDYSFGYHLLLQPATVSRCGMIYMEPSQLGWEPLVISWMNNLPDTLQALDNRSLLLELFQWLLPPALRMLRKHCRVSNQDTNICRTFRNASLSSLIMVFVCRKLFPRTTVTLWCPCVDCLRCCSLNLWKRVLRIKIFAPGSW